jgi:hypothetical protein
MIILCIQKSKQCEYVYRQVGEKEMQKEESIRTRRKDNVDSEKGDMSC